MSCLTQTKKKLSIEKNSIDQVSIFCFFRFRLKAEKSKNRKCPQVYSIFAFFRLLGKTEKWKMDKNILVSHKEDFSNFLIHRKIRKMEK